MSKFSKTVVFISNYFNHHQKPFSDKMYELIGDNYSFVETVEMPEYRKSLGYNHKNEEPYLVPFREGANSEIIDRINNADVVIVGDTRKEFFRERLESKKLTFIYSERLLKKRSNPLKFIVSKMKLCKKFPTQENVYVLCAGGYVAQDYARFGLFKNKCYKWGYFPETISYEDIDELIDKKIPNSIVWVARFVDWKHPEIAVKLGKQLKKDGCDFQINMIGNGEMIEDIKKKVLENGLEENIHVLGAMSPEQVREHMEKSQIHIFTSDRNEGWGAVLNESMNSACAVVADKNIGATPYLIEDKCNGFLYKNTKELFKYVKDLLKNNSLRNKIAKKAYETIIFQWNSTTAAERFIEMLSCMTNDKFDIVYNSGVLSKEKQ